MDSGQLLNLTEMDVRLKELDKVEGRFNNKSSNPKIQKIPAFLRQIDVFRKYCCTPKIISMGPIHHGEENLKEGEHYKLLLASRFVKDQDQDAQVLLKRIKDNIQELKELFSEDAIEGYKDKDNELAWMLFVDGCSLLHFMENADTASEALKLKFGQGLCMWKDITLLLENQLPRRLLEMLTKKDLSSLIRNFVGIFHLENNGEVEITEASDKAIHLLDYFRWLYHYQNKIDTGDCQIEIDGNGEKVNWFTNKNIRDLKTAGIRLVPVMPQKILFNTWNKVSFTSKWFSGELRLPFISLQHYSCHTFLNMIAYEMCPDVNTEYEFSSYFSFLDSLIDTAEDVKELRLAGVFQNLLGTDQDMVNIINQMGEALPDSVLLTSGIFDSGIYRIKKCAHVKRQIEKHYNCKWRTWLAQAYNTHFKTPWAIITLLAASLLLVLSFIQTWFTLNPTPNK